MSGITDAEREQLKKAINTLDALVYDRKFVIVEKDSTRLRMVANRLHRVAADMEERHAEEWERSRQ